MIGILAAALMTQAGAMPPFWVRAGYKVTPVVQEMPNARFLAGGEKGQLFVSRFHLGRITFCRDKNGDGFYEARSTFVKDMPGVQAMTYRDGYLWFATPAFIFKARDTSGDGVADEVIKVMQVEGVPGGSSHWWRSMLLTDRYLYTSHGDIDNISEQDSDRQKLWRYNLDGSGKTLFASGIRNNEEYQFRPGTDEIWGFDNGSDGFGSLYGETEQSYPITDVNPPEELNHYVEGAFYGHPYLTGNRVPRPEFEKTPNLVELAAKTTVPEWCGPAHWAIQGFTFVDPKLNKGKYALPKDHDGDVFFAAHGSWNSSNPVGYCVGRVLFDAGKPYGMLKIVSCLDAEGHALARPVDVAQMPDGSILFSSDEPEGAVYRITKA